MPRTAFVQTALAAMLVMSLGGRLAGQGTHGATITGVVRDSSSRPVVNADVIANPDNHRTRTDSAGHFTLTGLDGGRYTVHARKFGYSPAEWTADLQKNGHLDISLTLGTRIATLDTVYTREDGTCSILSLDGFMCRRQRGGNGLYLDYTDIDDRGTTYTADLFRDIDGFRVEMRPSRIGVVSVPVSVTGSRCITYLVDGRPLSGAIRVPEYSGDVVAMEVYKTPSDVPKEYQQYIWRFSGRCSLVVYWTQLAALRP